MKNRIYKVVGVILILTLLAGCSDRIASKKSSQENDEVVGVDKEKTELIEKYIDQYYYFDVDENKREDAYYNGILQGLDDPYSVYYNEEELKELLEDTEGKYYGIGVSISQHPETNYIEVIKPFKDAPAYNAGIKAGDLIVEVDGEDVSTQKLEMVVNKLRGEGPSEVNIKVYRKSEGEYLFFDVVRDDIVRTYIEYEMLDDGIGYIMIEQFGNNTEKAFDEAITDLEAQGAKGLIVDLRDNPGGTLLSVIKMVDRIIEGGKIVFTKDKNGNITSEYKANDGIETDIPLVVLVNGNSASASEVFSGAIKDHERGKIIGTTTYGKGIVQNIINLGDGTGIKLTIAKYFTPDGNDIHEIGIVPDVEVHVSEEFKNAKEYSKEVDNQLQKAIEELKKEIK